MSLLFQGHAIAQWQDGRSATLIAEGTRTRWVSPDRGLACLLNRLMQRHRPRAGDVRDLTRRCLRDPASPQGGQLISLHQESQEENAGRRPPPQAC